MDERDLPDPILPANLIYRAFRDKHTGLNGQPVPFYQINDETITKMEYFRRVLVRKVNANSKERQEKYREDRKHLND